MSVVKQAWVATSLVGWLAVGVVPLGASAAEIQLTVSVPHPDSDGGVATNRLRLGMTPSASNAFDPSLDLEALPAPGLSAVVRHPEYAAAHQLLWWDLRADAFPQVWEVEVSSDRPNASITISGAAPPTVPNGCSQGRWTIRDANTNQTLDLGASPLTYEYSNTVAVIRRFVVSAVQVSATPPPAPQNLWSPRQGRGSAYLAWSGGATGDVQYHVYRQTDQGTVRLTTTPIGTASYVVTGVDRTAPVTFLVTAVRESGCESGYSVPMTLPAHR
jgi:hypothetical protein